MHDSEAIHHLERVIAQLKKHVAEQDAEIYKLTKLVDSLSRKVEILDKRLTESGMDSPIDTDDHDPSQERPPHY